MAHDDNSGLKSAKHLNGQERLKRPRNVWNLANAFKLNSLLNVRKKSQLCRWSVAQAYRGRERGGRARGSAEIPQNANDRLISPTGHLGMPSIAAYGKQLLATLLCTQQQYVDSFLKSNSSCSSPTPPVLQPQWNRQRQLPVSLSSAHSLNCSRNCVSRSALRIKSKAKAAKGIYTHTHGSCVQIQIQQQQSHCLCFDRN